MKLYSFLLCVFFLLASTAYSATPAAGAKGTWMVKSTLVAAQDAVNQNYTAGMNRIERWYVSGTRKAPVIRTDTSNGETITGQKVGKAWVFDSWYDTGYGIALHVHIVLRARGRNAFRGTEEVHYYETTFGQIMGVDAWALRGRKRRR